MILYVWLFFSSFSAKMHIILCIIFVLHINHLVIGSVERKNCELEQLQILFRHGDRTPGKEEILANDPHDEIYRKVGYGKLTRIGKERMYKIGQILRNRYDDFLGEYRIEDVYAYSSDIDRTKMSLQLLLTGLYPPTESTIWSDTIFWHPIPTHYDPWSSGFLSAAFGCVPYMMQFREVGEELKNSVSLQEYESFLNNLEQQTGITITTYSTAWLIYDNLRAALSYGLPLPNGFSMEGFHKLEQVMAIVYSILTYNEKLRRMKAGPIVERFLKVLNDDNSEKKIYLYGGHDLNVAAYINAHNITGAPSIMDYGSTVILERLRGPDGQKYVRLLLWTGVSEELLFLKFDGCDELCPLSEYEKLVEPILPNEDSRICTSSKILCRREMDSKKKIDPDLQLSYFFAESDLRSFKYMKNFLPSTVEN